MARLCTLCDKALDDGCYRTLVGDVCLGCWDRWQQKNLGISGVLVGPEEYGTDEVQMDFILPLRRGDFRVLQEVGWPGFSSS